MIRDALEALFLLLVSRLSPKQQKKKRQNDAEQDTSGKGEIEGEIALPINDIAG
jgi:hypothetical protein